MTAMPTELPNDLIGLIGFLAVLGYLAWTTRRQSAQHAEQTEQIERVRHQVENSHTSNMRDDIDGLMAKVDTLLAADTRRRDVDREQHATLARLDDRTARIGDEVREDRADRQELRREVYRLALDHRRIVEKHHPEDAGP